MSESFILCVYSCLLQSLCSCKWLEAVGLEFQSHVSTERLQLSKSKAKINSTKLLLKTSSQMLEAGKAAPTEFCRENQTIKCIYFSGLVFFSLTHCWSRGFYMLKPLTIAIGPSGLFWFNIECSANFYWKSYWSDPLSVLWLKWLFKTRNSKPLICCHWWCSRSWKTQKTCSGLTSGSRLLLHLSFSFSSLLVLLHLLGCLGIFVFVWGFLFWLLLSLKGH